MMDNTKAAEGSREQNDGSLKKQDSAPVDNVAEVPDPDEDDLDDLDGTCPQGYHQGMDG